MPKGKGQFGLSTEEFQKNNLVRLLFAAILLLCTYGNGTALAQALGDPISGVTFTDDYGAREQAAVYRAVTYWNDVLDTNTADWKEWGFTGIIAFDKDTSDLGDARAHANGSHVSVRPNSHETTGMNAGYDYWTVAENSQFTILDNPNHSNSLEATMIHELAHSLGIGGSTSAFTVTEDNVTTGTGTVSSNVDGTGLPTTWGRLILAPGGGAITAETTYTLVGNDPFRDDPALYDESKFFTFDGAESKAVYGDKWLTGADKKVPVISGLTGFFSHLFYPASGTTTYQWPRRSFLAEAEMAVMADLGHAVKIDRFYGRSIYGIHTDPIVVDSTNADVLNGTVYTAADGTTGWTGNGKFAVGLHIVHQDNLHNPGVTAPGNNVTVQTHLVSTGEYGTGIRIEGWNHEVTVGDGILVAATGKDGIGVLFTGMGGYSGGSTLNIEGTILAQQEEDGKLTRAIVVDPSRNYTTVSAINVTGDAVITGIIDILNDNDLAVVDGASLSTTAGLEFLTGNLVMDSGSTLKVNLNDNNESDQIVFDTGTSATVGAIDIEVQQLLKGTYTLIDSDNLNFTSAELKYKGQSFASGDDIGHFGNVQYDFDSAAVLDGELKLTISDFAKINIGLNWTGTAGGNLWDETAENWDGLEKIFANGDAVTFNLDVEDEYAVNIAEGGVTVADMTVNSSKNWIFTGNIKGSNNSEDTTLTSNAGKLTKAGLGSLTLNGNNQFNTVSIDGGTTVVTSGNTLTGTGGVTVAVDATLTGNGTVASNLVTVNGTLSAGDTAGKIGTLNIDGDLTMADGSTLAVDLDRNETPTSDKIAVTGTATLGSIEIDMLTLFRKGTYTLITSGDLITDTGGLAANIVLDGTSIDPNDTFGRLSAIAPAVQVNENELQLIVNATQDNIALKWKGDADGHGTWDFTTENWEGTKDNYFLRGDAVTFDLSESIFDVIVTREITIGEGTRTVADMTVDSADHWIFTGDITGSKDSTTTTLADSTGKLTKNGTGTLTLVGNAVFAEGATVNSGMLQIGNGGETGTFVGDIATNAGTTVDFNRSGIVMYNDVISGAGSLNKDGDGTLFLTNTNTYTGGTTIAAGSLQIGNGAVTGNGSIALDNVTVENGANLVFNRTDTVSINDTIFGGGTTKVASGTLIGSGTIEGSFVVGSRATFSPGNSIGTFTVGGDVTFENGSTYFYEIDNAALVQSNDLLTVSDTSTVTIVPGAVLDIHLTGDGKRGDEFQVIAANGALFTDGTKFIAEDNNPLFDIEGNWGTEFYQEILADGYYIGWRAVAPEFVNALQQYSSPNALNAAAGVDEIATLAEQAGIIDQLYNVDFYDALTNFSSSNPGALANAFEQLHGEVFASSKEAAAQLQRSFANLMPTGREIVKLSDVEKPANRWGLLTGETKTRDNLGRYSGYDLTSTGLAVGIDRTVMGNLLIGAALGYDYASQDFDSIRAKSEIDAFRTMVYTRWYNGTYFIDAYGGYTKNYFENERYINIDTLSATARSKYDADLGSAGVDFGKTMWMGKSLITPSIGMHYIHMDQPDTTETGAGSANLYVFGEDYQSLRMPMGFKASQTFSEENGLVWTPEVRLYYVREWMDDSARVHTAFDALRSTSFVADSGNWGRDSGQAGVGVSARLSSVLSARLDYDFEFYKNTNAHVFAGSLGVNW